MNNSITLIGREFRKYGEVMLDRNLDGNFAEYCPRHAELGNLIADLNPYGAGSFCSFSVSGLPKEKGVFVFFIGDAPLYAGKSVDLDKEIRNGFGRISYSCCGKKGQATHCRINHLILKAAQGGKEVSLFVHPCSDGETLRRTIVASIRPTSNMTC